MGSTKTVVIKASCKGNWERNIEKHRLTIIHQFPDPQRITLHYYLGRVVSKVYEK